jgi:hypothetical protein
MEGDAVVNQRMERKKINQNNESHVTKLYFAKLLLVNGTKEQDLPKAEERPRED